MTRTIGLALLLLFVAEVRSDAAETWHAIDGDTILLTTTGRRVTATEKLRLVDVDAPELHARCEGERIAAEAARGFVAAALAGAGEIRVERVARADKYGRTLAVVRLDGVSLSAMLLGAGLVRPYHGERRRGWCD